MPHEPSSVIAASKPNFDFEEVQIPYDHWIKLMKPRIKFVTKYISNTITKSLPSPITTATVIVKKCLPRDLKLPFCDEHSALLAASSLLDHHDSSKNTSI